jgi:hypothetical protein
VIASCYYTLVGATFLVEILFQEMKVATEGWKTGATKLEWYEKDLWNWCFCVYVEFVLKFCWE